MIRTTKGTAYTYATITANEDGTLTATPASVYVPYTEPKKAYREAVKIVGNFAPIAVEVVQKVYEMDDNFFFTHAREMSKEETLKYLATHTKND